MEPMSNRTTCPRLLARVRDVADHPAWVEFVERYEPLMQRWCGYYELDDQSADELCVRAWERLWPRMRTFQYDPSRRFRSWLRRFFHSRAMDMLGERAATAFVSIDAVPSEDSRVLSFEPDDISPEEDECDDASRSTRFDLLRQGREAQESVQRRVDPANWDAYWLTTIDELPIAEVARAQGRSHVAVYYGVQRVKKMLRQEGERRLASFMRS